MPSHPSPSNKPTRWWHKVYYGFCETLRHWVLSWIASLPAPTQFIWRNRIFTAVPRLFRSSSQYHLWQNARAYFITERPKDRQLIKLDTIDLSPLKKQSTPPRIAVHAHMFYPEVAPLLATYLAQFPQNIDLFISNPKEQDQDYLYKQFEKVSTIKRLEVRLTPNQGRDIAPMIDPFGKTLLEYDYIAHIHSKKSVGTNNIGQLWCDYLWESVLSNQNERLSKIWALLQDHSMVYPEKFHLIDVANCRWGNHLPRSIALCEQLNISPPTATLTSEDFVEFPVGSMFWARADALAPLLASRLSYQDFEAESGKTDGTLNHTIERNLTYIALSQGLPIAVLQNTLFSHAYP
jgi:lipopolysaccharide biosynthesis protein